LGSQSGFASPTTPGVNLTVGNTTIARSFATRLGLDLEGGVQALLEADMPANATLDPDAMNTARSIVEKRVNGLGVSEAVVQTAGSRRILVEIPGEKDPEKALEAVRKTGLLEFVDFTQLSDQEISALDLQTIQTDFGQTGQAQPGSEGTGTPAAVSGTQTPAQTPQVTSTPLASSSTVTNTQPITTTQVFHTIMTGTDLKDVGVITDQSGKPVVSFTLSPNGTQIFSDFTTQNVGKALAIVLDKKVISSPRINNAITTGKGIIEGNFTVDSANNLSIQLKYGSLPVPLKVVSSQTIGPTLGQISLTKSLLAGAIGLTIVILFMALYYRLPGLVADVALIVYSLITLAIFKLIPVTLTLPGIAGFVLSIGMAVDANILIFSRMKEELRAGRPLKQAIDLGWGRAWPSIRDSNFSTLITCAILFIFGNAYGASIVKGFSVTLAIGVLVSMFTAIFVSRTFLHLVLDNIPLAHHFTWFGVTE
jgi:preprotein translocase subunit SecD